MPTAAGWVVDLHPIAAHLPQEILASKDADHSARWLAAVHFKNSCNKYWRSRLPGWVLLLVAAGAGSRMIHTVCAGNLAGCAPQIIAEGAGVPHQPVDHAPPCPLCTLQLSV